MCSIKKSPSALCMLGKISADETLKQCSYFSLKTEDNAHEMSVLFSEKNKKKYHQLVVCRICPGIGDGYINVLIQDQEINVTSLSRNGLFCLFVMVQRNSKPLIDGIDLSLLKYKGFYYMYTDRQNPL